VAGPVQIPASARAGVMREELGKLPGGEAKLMWGLAGAGAQQGGRSTVKQEALRGRASGGGARVRGGCSGLGVRAQGVGGSYLWGNGAT
jgi:hypothetical protein